MRTVRRVAAVAALALGLGAWTPYAAAEPVDIGGRPVDGSTDSAEPTSLEAGLWTVMLGPESQPQFFRYERQIEDSTIHIGAVGAPQTPDGDGLQLAPTVPDPASPTGIDCSTNETTTSSSAPAGLIGTQVIVGNEDGDTGAACRAADAVDVKLIRYSSSSTVDLPVAIKIVEEAPVSDQGEPLPEEDVLDPGVPDPVDAVTTPGGAGSFDDAPIVDASGGPVTIATEITEGSELLWRVPLTWADQLVVRADIPAITDREQEQLGYPTAYLRLAIVQPSRDISELSVGDDTTSGQYGGLEDSRMVAATYPLRYANRFADDVAPTLPGDTWVSIAVAAAPEDREALDVPIELTFEVTATDNTGPTYKAAVLSQGGGAGPDGYSPGTPYLVGDGEFSAVASGNPFTPDGDEGDEWWGLRRGVGVGVGVVSLACCAVGAVWLTRRRAH